jgi:uncharacterized iron-regulated protein
MKRFLLAMVTMGFITHAPISCVQAGNHDNILRISDGERVTLYSIVGDLEGVQLVFMGELHNDAGHHQAQLAVIKALKQAGVSVAVGLEMFRRSSQVDLGRWVAGRITEGAFQRIYYENWSSDWHLYRDIFLYAQERKIPMIGLNISPGISRKVADQGFASLTSEELGQLPEVSCRVDPTYMAFIRRAFGLHGHNAEKSFTYFCEAQIVWDTAMASNLLTFLEKNPEYTVVVLAGSGHAWKRGIPEQVRRQSSDVSYRVILPEIPNRLESATTTLDDTDYLWLGP